MKIIRYLSFLSIAVLLTGCFYPSVNAETSTIADRQVATSHPTEKTLQTTAQELEILDPTPVPTKMLPIIPENVDSAPDLYGCEMRIEFSSGPLADQISKFEVLDESYFEDKGEKFAVGKGTAVYYESQPYLILHSSYVNGNVLKPMEAEFIRKYLENWGRNGDEYIQGQIDSLIGSQVNWYCGEDLVLETIISSIARLSHAASERLWLQPTEIEDILTDKEGLASEWIGEITPTDEPNIYLGFCGWGPTNLEYGRYTYFRYLLNFTIQNP